MLHWNWRSFQELSNTELYDVLALRQTVFIDEQQCRFIDIDYRDQQCMHLLGMKDNKLAAYLRVLPKNLAYPNAVSFGRVVTAPFVRGTGAGKEMMREVLTYLQTHHHTIPIIISAQMYLERFYQSFNFKTISEAYMEDGISHIKMEIR